MTKLLEHHHFRIQNTLSWRAEYILAHIAAHEGCKMGFLRDFCIRYHSVPKIVQKLVQDGFVEIKQTDKLRKFLYLTDKGKNYINSIEAFYQA